MPANATTSSLMAQLASLLPGEQLLCGGAVMPYASDIFSTRHAPLAVAVPHSVAQLQETVALSTAAGHAVVVRGGGASYTEGYLPAESASIMVDLRRLDRIVEVNVDDAYVTVEAGVTWAQLKATLDPLGLRTPFRGPFSGEVATVGGTVAQHAISHGTSAHGGSAASVLCLDVVLADGRILSTGSAAHGGSPFFRHVGPDLAGLFTGDCGWLGIKARITLPLIKAPARFAAASFAYPDFEALHAGLRAAAWAQADDTHFALDAALLGGQLARPRSVKEDLSIARGVWRSSPHAWAALSQLARMALAGKDRLKTAPYVAHHIIEGHDAQDVAVRAQRLRAAIRPHGQEIVNTVPAVIRSKPFAKMFHVTGPAGERWVPVHGVLPHSRVPGFRTALQALLGSHADRMRELGIWHGTLFETVGCGAMIYEIGLYWPDSFSEYHRMTLGEDRFQKLSEQAPHLATRRFVTTLRLQLVDLYQAHGATHFQLGKLYPYGDTLQPTARMAVEGIKAMLDPLHRLNPGALGMVCNAQAGRGSA